MNVGTGGAGDMQVLEEQRMAAIESPADKRETLGDKVRQADSASQVLSSISEYMQARTVCMVVAGAWQSVG
jgi:hypothetical protein